MEKEVISEYGTGFYKRLLSQSPMGYAYHKIICDEVGNPVDYEFIEVNRMFEALTGLKADMIIGKRVTEVLPGILEDEFKWIAYYGEVALQNVEKELEQYSFALGKYYRVNAFSPEQGFFVTSFVDITKEREQLDELNGFFEVNLDLFCITDLSGLFIKVNKAWETTLGYDMNQLKNQKFMDFIHPQDLEDSDYLVSALCSNCSEKGVSFVNRYLGKDGQYRVVEWRSHSKGKLIYAAGRDITERVEIEAELLKEKERNELVIMGSNDGFWDWDIETNELYLSPKWKQQLGYGDDEIPNTFAVFEGLIFEDDKAELFDYVSRYLNSEIGTYDATFRMVHKEGALRYIRARGVAIRDGMGKPLRMGGSHTDITLEKEHEVALREKEQNFTSFFETIDDLLMVADKNGTLLYVNGATINKLGYSIDELRRMHILELHPKERRQEAEQIFSDMFAGKRSTCPLPLETRGGVLVPVETRIWFGTWNNQPCIFGVVKDLSIKEAAFDKFHKLFDNNPALMAVTDLEDRTFKEVNEAFCSTLGYTKEELFGRTATEIGLFVAPQMQVEVGNSLRTQGKIRNMELEVRSKDGSILTGLFSGEVIDNQLERSFLTVMTDITALKNSERQLKIKDRILSAVAKSTDILLESMDYMTSISKCFELLGIATGVDRVYLFVNSYDAQGKGYASQKIEWNSGLYPAQIDNPDLQNVPFDQFESFLRPLKNNEAYFGRARDFDTDIKAMLDAQMIQALVVMPVFVNKVFWGFIGFDECKYEREWSEIECTVLNAFSGTLERAIERQMIEAELQVARHKAESANLSKTQFLANMSHEIRTPMNGVLGMLSLLGYTSLSDEQASYVKEARNSSEILLYLINDILDISKIEAGKMTIEKTTFDIRAMVEDAISMFTANANEKNLALELSMGLDVPTRVLGDPARLRQVLNNLVSNALKFTHDGKINVDLCRVEDLGDCGDRIKLKFTITDTGIGMSEEVIDRIFKPFVQGDPSTTREYGGTGLGLAISRELVHLMHGQIRVESAKGVGSVFEFTCEFEGPSPGDVIVQPSNPVQTKLGTTNEVNQEKDSTELKILLVEDNVINQKVALKILQKQGYKCDVASNGEEAVLEWKKHHYDLIFMDCQMPIMDGYEATIQIRLAENGARRTKIVAMTAYAMAGDREKCLASGMDDYITKPIEIDMLLRHIDAAREGLRREN